jgi:hypothetical protein
MAAPAEAALYGLLVDTTLRQLADTQQQARLYVVCLCLSVCVCVCVC